MAEIREQKGRVHGLRANERDVRDVPQHVESPGDALIKQLVQKQTSMHTTLQEQLAIQQRFQREGNSQQDEATSSSVEDLQKKTGLSRDELENALSIKPESAVAKLYRFALSNQSGREKQKELVANLPNHPMNHLKSLEQDLMKSIGNASATGEKRKRKKHRVRKKRKLVVATVAERPRATLWDVEDMTTAKNSNPDKHV